MTSPIEVSDSQIKNFQDCARKWAYHKLLGLSESEDKNAMFFGNAWHDGAEEYIKSRSIEKAINAALTALNKDKPTDLETAKLLVPALLTGWVIHFLPGFEKEYEYIATEQWFSHSPNKDVLTIRGFKDAVCLYRPTRERCVFDYKTSGASYAAELISTLSSNNQLARYATAERREFGAWPKTVGLIFAMKPRNKDIQVACENARCDPDMYKLVKQEVTPEFAEFALSVEVNDTLIGQQMQFYKQAVAQRGPQACDSIPANFGACYAFGRFCGFAAGCHKGRPAHQALANKPS